MYKIKPGDLTDVYSEPPIPILEIAEQRVRVLFCEFPSTVAEVLANTALTSNRIYVNSAETLQNQRWGLARELARWLLHRQIFLDDARRYLPTLIQPEFYCLNELDRAANNFAVRLLMPRSMLQHTKHCSYAEIADIFNVSLGVVNFRMMKSET